MPRRSRASPRRRKKLDDYLVLNHYMCSLFGYDSFDDLKKQFEDVKEGYDEDGRSYMYHRILSLKNVDKRIKNKLEDYDDNIRSYLNYINQRRDFKISLKYFQYLAVLFTEIYLDFYFQDPVAFMNELTEFGLKNKEKYGNNIDLVVFESPNKLRNLAFWMATGSGKTLIMHINYLQFLRYNKGRHKINYENFILITPNAGLTQQHMKELQLSSIPCEYFLDSNTSAISTEYPPVKVIEITKFTGEKKGEGVSIDIRSVTSQNIVFADEAHKGTGGDAWRTYRERLSKDGFKFEYSATFGQALKKVSPDDELLQLYAKSILFDYSYKYFYSDGYGKDYRIINTRELTEELQHTFLLANALSFYEQIVIYDENDVFRKGYNIERPLWIFIGSRVQPGNNQSRTKTISDILKVVRFIHRFVNDEEWAIKSIKNILDGKSGILDKEGNDVFIRTYPETKFPYLRKQERDIREIYKDMKRRIFKNSSGGTLYLVNIKNADGEIGLKIGPFGKYFGVINIGDKDGFLRVVKERHEEYGFMVERDDTTLSLFENLERSNIDILIGARKFVEGWNSWRVSTMGLINMGKSEGPLIIQLFGRGVRLKGYKKMLKRSSVIKEMKHPDFISVLETLNVFGIQANYMEIFKEYLEKEGVPTEPVREYEIPVELHEVVKKRVRKLHIPRVEKERDFLREEVIHLEKDPHIKVSIDLRPQALILTSIEEEALRESQKEIELHIDPKYIDLLNWDYMYLELTDYAKEKGWYNLIITKEAFYSVLLPDLEGDYLYSIYLPDPDKIIPKKLKDLPYIEDLVLRILRKYMSQYYYKEYERWENDNLTYYELTPEDDNFFDKYIIKIKESDISKFEELIKVLEMGNYQPFYEESNGIKTPIMNVYIDVHLYQPLLAKSVKNSDIKIIPVGLNDSEIEFIEYLKQYLRSVKEELRKKNIYVYILRNRTRGKGIGFFENYGFYPDFIAWIKNENENKHYILFIEPHGLAHPSLKDKEKINLSTTIKDREKDLYNRTGLNITLDSYILSATKYDQIRHIFGKSKLDMEKSNIFFMKDEGVRAVQKIFSKYI